MVVAILLNLVSISSTTIFHKMGLRTAPWAVPYKMYLISLMPLISARQVRLCMKCEYQEIIVSSTLRLVSERRIESNVRLSNAASTSKKMPTTYPHFDIPSSISFISVLSAVVVLKPARKACCVLW